MEIAANIFEIVMVLCFGASWPFNIVRAYKARTAKSTSLLFTLLIGTGYVAGIVSKIFLVSERGSAYWTAGFLGFVHTLAFVFYIINLCMIITALLIYFRNKKLDAKRTVESEQA